VRFIDKKATCKPLQQRRNNKPKTDVDAKKAWKRFNKKAIRKACYKQQQGLCSYTELSLDNPILGSHLEHIAPRSRFPDRTFDNENIILAAMNEHYSGQLELQQRFGGHFKQASYDDDWFIGPFDRRCEQFFRYCDITGKVLANSEIKVVDQNRTTKTIEVLNLNCQYLVKSRLQHLAELRIEIESSIQVSHLSLQEKQSNIEQLKLMTLSLKENKLPIFYSAKKQLFDRFKVI